MASDTNNARKGLYKISDLARETGVSAATIKFYMREGLLPAPTLKTGRNMAYYDRSFVDRIRIIKELQQKRFLPLDIIKAILDRDENVVSQGEINTLMGLEGNLYEEIHYSPGHKPISRQQAIARYQVTDENLDYCIELDVLTPVIRNGVEYFEGDDVLILETFRSLQEANLGSDVVPPHSSMPMYVRSIKMMAKEELKLFTRAVTGKFDPAEVAEMAQAGIKLVEQLIVLLRRKLLLQAIGELRDESEHEATGTDD